MTRKRYHGESFEIDEDYFNWLCEYVGADNRDVLGYEKLYLGLMRHLYDRVFDEGTAYLIPNDENRIADGKRLRNEFKEESLFLEDDYRCLDGPCSVLEMLVALSQRMSDLLEWDTRCDDAPSYFWEFIDNLDLAWVDDEIYNKPSSVQYVDEIVDQLLNRSYCKDGSGGIFPLENPKEDQKEVEIWYQMAAYINENYPV